MAIQPNPASHTNLLALPDGTELVGDYRIKRVLGAGGFGITYLADEMALARLVTIKEYFPAEFAARRATSDASPRSQDCAEDYKWGLERFIEEAQTLARFVHPNIVRVYRYFRANNTGYMVLHFEEGGSFKAWLKGLKRAPRQPELDKILRPLLEALEMVHAGDFLHRDIAPDNIIIRKDGSPVLIDFGSARGEIASHSKTVSALVKPGYSPYEQYATTSRQQGPWTDIYALGATLYHAVTGKRPPDAPSRMVNDEYVPARAAALSSYRPGFLAAIDKALRLEVGERPQSIAQWREQLLAPEPKRERGRLSLGRALDRLRTGDPARSPGAAETARQREHRAAVAKAEPEPEPACPRRPTRRSRRASCSTSSTRLKKRRSGLAARRRRTPARRGLSPHAAPRQRRRRDSSARARPSAAASRPWPRRRPPRPRASQRPAAGKCSPAGRRLARAASAAWASRRGAGARCSTGWRSGWASPASPSPIRTSCRISRVAAPASCRARPPTCRRPRASPATAARSRALPPATRGAGSCRAGADGTLRVWNAGSGAPVRTIELDDGPATAIAVDDRRALTGHKERRHRPVGPGARREARAVPAASSRRSPRWPSPATPTTSPPQPSPGP